MTTHRIPMVPTNAGQRAQYGVEFTSAFVYRTSKSTAPTRIDMWANRKPNPRDGQPVRYGEYGPIDGGNGRLLDPGNRATDEPVSVLLSPESTVITAQRNGTGHPDSGQVWGPQDDCIRPGDTLLLVFADGRQETWRATFSNNGHGDGVRIPVIAGLAVEGARLAIEGAAV